MVRGCRFIIFVGRHPDAFMKRKRFIYICIKEPKDSEDTLTLVFRVQEFAEEWSKEWSKVR